jgi:hypothetical protein
MFLEERDDDVPQICEPPDVIPTEILSVIVASTIHVHMTASKEAVHVFQDLTTTR